MTGRHQGGGRVVEGGTEQRWGRGEVNQRGAEKPVWRQDEKPERPILFQWKHSGCILSRAIFKPQFVEQKLLQLYLLSQANEAKDIGFIHTLAQSS